jgi:tripeptide aminopeptidase
MQASILTSMDSKRLLKTFLDLVQIPSESGKEKPVTDYLVAKLKSLGLEVWVDDAGSKIGSNSGNIMGRLKGSLPGSIAFSSHQDTVVPGVGIKPQIADGIIRSDGTTILGADDKAGLACILEMFECIKDKPHPTIEVVFDICEEIGLRGAAQFDTSKLESKHSIILDVDGAPGRINIAAPYQDVCKITIKGKPSHAGIAPEKGISAIVIASKAIASMKLGKIDDETTSNVGIISGGKANNIVPEECKVEMEARSRDEAKLNAQTKHMLDRFEEEAKKAGATIEVSKERVFMGYKFSETDPLPSLVAQAAKDVGLKPQFVRSGGGSVSNIFNAKGLASVVVGVGFENPHSKDEFLRISDLEASANWVIRMVELVK